MGAAGGYCGQYVYVAVNVFISTIRGSFNLPVVVNLLFNLSLGNNYY